LIFFSHPFHDYPPLFFCDQVFSSLCADPPSPVMFVLVFLIFFSSGYATATLHFFPLCLCRRSLFRVFLSRRNAGPPTPSSVLPYDRTKAPHTRRPSFLLVLGPERKRRFQANFEPPRVRFQEFVESPSVFSHPPTLLLHSRPDTLSCPSPP